jgi:lipoprotein-releasing system permease protein
VSDAAAQSAGGTKGPGPFSAFEFMLAMRYLRARRKQGGVTLISIISFFGIMLAVTALIAVMSVMNGFRHELLTRLLGVQPHIYVYAPADSEVDRGALADQIRGLDGVRQAGPVAIGQALVTSRRGAAFAQVAGVRAEDLRRFDLITGDNGAREAGGGIVQGSVEMFGEGRNGGDEIIIGSVMASTLGVIAGDDVTLVSPRGAATALGVTPRSKRYVVGAVISVGVQDLDQILAYMPIEQAALFFNRPAGGDFIDVRIETPDEPDAIKAAIEAIAPERTLVLDWRGQNEAFWNALQVERVAMRLILMVIVAIAAMNIISGLVMLVKNKTKDIAILRTMGASQGAVMRIFLISGATVGVLGTIAGIILGLLFAAFIGPIQDFVGWASGVNIFDPEVYQLYRLPARVDWNEVVFVAVWGFVMAVIATLPPSLRAGRMDPVEALRNE